MTGNRDDRHMATTNGRRHANACMRTGRDARSATSSTVRRPLNAVDAAKRAARADNAVDEERFRSAAAGTHMPRGTHASSDARAQRRIRVVALIIGAMLAALAFYAVSQAIVRVMTYSDKGETAVEEATTAAGDAMSARAATFDGDASDGQLRVGRFVYRAQSDDDGRVVIVRGDVGSSAADGIGLFEVAGDVVGMAYAHGALYVAANVDDGYEVWSYIDSQGTSAESVLSGEGTIDAIECGEHAIEVVTESGDRAVVVRLDEE